MSTAINYLVIIIGLSLGVQTTAWSFGKARAVQPDAVQDAILAGDATGLVEGCGNQPVVGFTYCRLVEGDAADQTISFIGPPAKCNDPDSCVFIKVFNQAGQIAWGGSIPKDQTRVYVSWRKLLGCQDPPATCQFQVGNRGFWTYDHEVHWIDPDGHDRKSISQGDIVLRVYHQGYTPLDKVEADPNFVWSWVDGNFIYHMTTGLRAYVGKKP